MAMKNEKERISWQNGLDGDRNIDHVMEKGIWLSYNRPLGKFNAA